MHKRQEEEKIAQTTVRELVEESFSVEKEQQEKGLVVEMLSSDQFLGQIIRDDERVVFSSLAASNKWIKRRELAESKPFEI